MKKRLLTGIVVGAVILVIAATNVKVELNPQFKDYWQQVTAFTNPLTPEIQGKIGQKDDRGFEYAYVQEAIDGDTVKLSDGRKLRYVGVDTPELHHPTKGEQCFGEKAYQQNKSLVEHQLVTLEKDVSETDKYGRLLRYIWLGDKLINQELVSEGYAVARSFPPDIARQDILRQAEKSAREQQKGLWKDCTVDPKTKSTQRVK
jgi:micrococcal nuclease